MKRIILIALLFSFVANVPVLAQYDPDYKHRERQAELYSSKVTSYYKMKKVGTRLGLTGGVLVVGGVALVSSANWETDPYTGNLTTTDSQGVTGMLMLLVGVPLAATGIVLGTIGSKKARSYQEKLNRLSFNGHCSPDKTSLSLMYKF